VESVLRCRDASTLGLVAPRAGDGVELAVCQAAIHNLSILTVSACN
jgi:hypothetical protein